MDRPDRAETERFLRALVGSVDVPVTFQTYDDAKKGRPLERILHGTLTEHWSELVRLNAAGAAVAIMVNEGDGQGRKDANVRALRALVADDDGGTLTPTALEVGPPSIIVQSRRGIQPWWRLRPGEPLERFKPAVQALAKALQTDPAAAKLPQVMRLPGFLHMKNPAAPFMACVVQASDVTYSSDEVLEAYGCAPAAPADPTPRRQRVQVNGHAHGYGAGALRSAADRVLAAPEGKRNETLNVEAFGIGQLVGGGVISRTDAEAVLEGAGIEADLTIAETRATVRSGLNAGQAQPRGVPDGVSRTMAGAADSSEPYVTHELTRMSTVQPKPVRWVWPGYMAAGKFSLIDGDPGNLKSTVGLTIGARVTRGLPMPGEKEALCGPARIIVVSAEDDAADTIRPRLEAAGADLEMVELLTIRRGDDKGLLPVLSEHMQEIEAALVESDAKFLLLDPMAAMLGSKIDMWKDQDVRRVLGPLKVVLERTDAASLGVRHLNKAHAGKSALYAGGGSIGLAGAARSVLCVARNPQNPVQRVLALLKSNHAEVHDVPSLAFHCEVVRVGEVDTIRLVWDGPSAYSADELLAAQVPESQEERSKLDEAKSVVLQALAAGPMLSTELEKQAKAAGVSPASLERARQKLGVRAIRTQDRGQWCWMASLPTRSPGHSTNADLEDLASNES